MKDLSQGGVCRRGRRRHIQHATHLMPDSANIPLVSMSRVMLVAGRLKRSQSREWLEAPRRCLTARLDHATAGAATSRLENTSVGCAGSSGRARQSGALGRCFGRSLLVERDARVTVTSPPGSMVTTRLVTCVGKEVKHECSMLRGKSKRERVGMLEAVLRVVRRGW